MSKFKVILLAFSLVASLASVAVKAEAGKSEKVKYDKFKDVTTVESSSHSWRLGRLGIYGGGAMSFQYSCPGQTTACHPSEIVVTFTRHGQEWLMMHDEKSMTFLADGRRITASNVSWDGIVGAGGEVAEWFIGALTPEDFRGIVAGQDVEVRIGTGTFTRRFNSKELGDWREFGSDLVGAAGAERTGEKKTE